MPINFHYNSDDNILVEKATGYFSDEEFLEAFITIFQATEKHHGARLFADFTETKNRPSTEAIFKSLSIMNSFSDKLGNTKWAIVVSELTDFGLASLFAEQTRNLSVNIKVFRDSDEAMKWLDLPDSL